MTSGRVGIVYPRAGLDTVPMLFNAAELLSRRGYRVDLFTLIGFGMEPPKFDSDLVSALPLGGQGLPDIPGLMGTALRGPRLLRRGLAPARRGYVTLQRAADRISSRLAQRLVRRAVAARHAADPYVCFIGVDPDGLVLADEIARPTGAPVAYLSLELLLTAEVRAMDEVRLKAQETALVRRAPFVVIQDEGRGRLLAEDNGISMDRLVFVPNAPLGPARRQPSTDLRQRLGLPSGARIVLHSGSLGAWTGIEDIARSAATWPDGWVLVIHTRYDAGSSAYVDQLRASVDPSRVFFSLKPLPRDEYDSLVDGADVGVAFYVPDPTSSFTGGNILTLGLSSGKLAYYARSGVPAVVNDATSVGALVEEAGCGVTVSSANQIGDALKRIEADYERYSERALSLFDTRLDYARGFEDVTRRIDELAATSAGVVRSHR